jgi:hypothetical protein
MRGWRIIMNHVAVEFVRANCPLKRKKFREATAVIVGHANPRKNFSAYMTQETVSNNASSPISGELIRQLKAHLRRHTDCTLKECQWPGEPCDPGWRIQDRAGKGIGYKRSDLWFIPEQWQDPEVWQPENLQPAEVGVTGQKVGVEEPYMSLSKEELDVVDRQGSSTPTFSRSPQLFTTSPRSHSPRGLR